MRPRIALPFVREFILPTIPLWTFLWLVQLQHSLHRELPAKNLEMLIRSRLVESSKRVCLADSKHVAQPTMWASASSVKFCDRLESCECFDFLSRWMLDFGQFNFGQLAEVEIDRSRNWPKSNTWCLLFFFFF